MRDKQEPLELMEWWEQEDNEEQMVLMDLVDNQVDNQVDNRVDSPADSLVDILIECPH